MQKDFRTAWLLLLLRDGSSYGYELRRELTAREMHVDPAVMYRTLRDMERSVRYITAGSTCISRAVSSRRSS